jgi:hypothetical protein
MKMTSAAIPVIDAMAPAPNRRWFPAATLVPLSGSRSDTSAPLKMADHKDDPRTLGPSVSHREPWPVRSSQPLPRATWTHARPNSKRSARRRSVPRPRPSADSYPLPAGLSVETMAETMGLEPTTLCWQS